jgi:hypothetical protein
MLSAAQQNALSPLAQQFLARLRAVLPGVASESHTHNGLTARVEPATSAVGALVAVVEDEIVVSLGDHTHEHFAPYLFGDARDPAAVLSAAEAAVEFIGDVLGDRVIIWSARRNGRTWAGGTCSAARGGRPSALATEAWLWSGRAVPLRRARGGQA